ncbi:lipase 3-like isoform X2 [Nilaparvata lugens]|uniref:lipase 3-like isoform X2 n=1 Tax=Nilaparvata lugens TaxID=108931 RepID=UPI00193E87BD|nr:lipase 3-like isoform X2 [Nilaparvata lugens]
MWDSVFKIYFILILSLGLTDIICGKKGKKVVPAKDEVKGWDKVAKVALPNIVQSGLKRTDEIIKLEGYEAYSYIVKVSAGREPIKLENSTIDSFYIEIFRLRHPAKKEMKNMPVVLLMHACTGSSSDFVFGGKEESLGFHLADAGYDVWLGNFRGNIYGGLNQYRNDTEFWDFSFDEHGLFDLPAQIDYILKKTKQPKLYYIGFSMGATAAYALLSSKTEYNEKIERMVLLSPVVYLNISDITFPPEVTKFFHSLSNKVAHETEVHDFFYWKGPLMGFDNPKCSTEEFKSFCALGMKSLSSDHKSLLNSELRNKFYSVAPIGSSYKTLSHYSNIAKWAKFKPFEYDCNKNQRVYGTANVKEYSLEKVNVPTLLLVGQNDKMFSNREFCICLDSLTPK